MITGFNTDIEHNGVVYHVQTEDKGLSTPLILSLVYAGGTILASKRTPYDDLVAAGFDERTLTERLQRQHKLICAAINSGRIEDLKQMSARAPGVTPNVSSPAGQSSSTEKPLDVADTSGKRNKQAAQKTTAAETKSLPPTVPPVVPIKLSPPLDPVDLVTPPELADFAHSVSDAYKLQLTLLNNDVSLRGGTWATLQMRVGRGAEGKEVVPHVWVKVKLLGSNFTPVEFSARTNKDGIATIQALVPRFVTGRAVALIHVEANGYEAELRKVVEQGE